MPIETQKENRMRTAKMFPLILSMSLPAMFSMLIQALYNIVDSYLVAQVSEKAESIATRGVILSIITWLHLLFLECFSRLRSFRCLSWMLK